MKDAEKNYIFMYFKSLYFKSLTHRNIEKK